MASVVKCLGTMAIGSFAGFAGSEYYWQRKINKAVLQQASAHAKDGKIPAGKMSKNGEIRNGQISVDEFKKELNNENIKKSLIQGVLGSLSVTFIAGVTLAVRGMK